MLLKGSDSNSRNLMQKPLSSSLYLQTHHINTQLFNWLESNQDSKSQASSSPKFMRIIRSTSYDHKALAICFALIAILSPLYIDKIKEAELEELEDKPVVISSYLPLLLLILIFGIALSGFLDRESVSRFDPNWIHRLCGSSTGIIILLLILSLVLKLKP